MAKAGDTRTQHLLLSYGRNAWIRCPSDHLRRRRFTSTAATRRQVSASHPHKRRAWSSVSVSPGISRYSAITRSSNLVSIESSAVTMTHLASVSMSVRGRQTAPAPDHRFAVTVRCSQAPYARLLQLSLPSPNHGGVRPHGHNAPQLATCASRGTPAPLQRARLLQRHTAWPSSGSTPRAPDVPRACSHWRPARSVPFL